MSKPSTARLIREFAVTPFGGDISRLADLNQDGRLEMLTLQSAGQMNQSFFVGRPDIAAADRELFCLTALTLEGRVLWQYGKPYAAEAPFTCHGGEPYCVDDVDADGRQEVVLIDHDTLVVLDAASGAVKARRSLGADNFTIVRTAQFGDPSGGRQILCKVNDRAYKPWTYGNPTIIFNSDLSVYLDAFEIRAAGHGPALRDIDADGRDEMFIGYSLLDHDGRQMWRLDFGPDFDYVDDHADEIVLQEMDGRMRVRYAGSEDFFVTDLAGNVLWRTHAGHSQGSLEGDWGGNGERRIILCEKNLGIWGIDAAGKVLWNRKDINGYATHVVRWGRAPGRTTWALFAPQLRPLQSLPAWSNPADSRVLWPSFIDGDGQLLDVLPWRDEYAMPSRLIRAGRSYDCGVKYQTFSHDIDGDGLDEIIVHNRDRLWIFHSGQ